MRVLLDTHVLLWALLSPSRLSTPVRDLLRDPKNEILVSSVSAWEIATKHRLGKLGGAEDLVRDYHGHLLKFRAEELVMTSAHALLAGRLEPNHRDPFDRMLAAQSMLEQVPLVTNDQAFKAFGTATLW